jgi:hypothetical protein
LKTQQIPILVFGLTRGEHANHYTTDIVAHLGFIYPHKAKLNVQLWLTSLVVDGVNF